MEHYITVEELRKPPFNLSECLLDSVYAEVLLDLTQEFIDNICKQSFFQEGSTGHEIEKRVRGSGGVSCYLAKRLITLKEVRIWSNITQYIAYGPENFQIGKRDLTWLTFSEGDSVRMRAVIGSAGIFPESVGSISVIGIWGYAEVPTPIKYLQGRLIQKLVREKTLADKQGSESIGDYSYSKLNLQNAITNDPELDLLIKRYQNWRIDVPI
jgi:hypothetical protein